MLAHGPQELDQLGVAGIEADADAGQVRALGQRVHGHHAVGAVLEHRAGRAVPGELGVALVGEHRDAVRPAPGRLRAEVAQAARRVRRRVGPEHAGRGPRRRRSMAPRSSPPSRPGGAGTGDGAAAGQLRAHGVGRIGHRGVEHRVPVRAGAGAAGAAPRPRAPWCPRRRRRTTAGTSVEPEAPGQPRRGGLAQLRAARPRRGSPARCPTTPAPRSRRASGGSQGVPMEQSTMPPSCASASLARPASRS